MTESPTEQALRQIWSRLLGLAPDTLTDDERAFLMVDRLVDGTDLYDFYYWHGGVDADLLPAAARRIGDSRAAELLEGANSLFPPGYIPAGSNGGTSGYLDDHEVDFRPIEREFAALAIEGRGLRVALVRFVQQHPEAFPEMIGVLD